MKKLSFIKKLDNKISKKILYRPYYRTYGCIDEVKLIKSYFPNIDILKNNLHDSLLDCKLLVLDHPGSTFSYAMAANVPTICYWDSKFFTLCAHAESSSQVLRKAGILFNNEHDAANKVNEVWEDIDSWWSQKEIQQARQEWSNNNIITNKFWLYEWIKALVYL